MKTYSLILAMVLSAVGLAHGQTSGLMKDTASVNFVNNAAVGGNMEVAAGTMALKKGKSPAVKAFASKMIKDHTKANAELAKLAMSKGYDQIPKKAKDDPMLVGSSGEEFDKHYIGMMVKDHKKTVMMFEKASTGLKHEQLKAFAAKTLPTLKMHLADVEKLASEMGVKEM